MIPIESLVDDNDLLFAEGRRGYLSLRATSPKSTGSAT